MPKSTPDADLTQPPNEEPTPPPLTLEERLNNPQATFSQQEFYAAFEILAERYGFYRDERLPAKGRQVQETTSMTVDGYTHVGVLVIRPRTMHDSMIGIPSLVDELLDGNFNPSNNTVYNATAIAMAKSFIVSPPGIVEEVLRSTNKKNLGFFNAFAKQYQKWVEDRDEDARQKNLGRT